jgi:hypothetical protein
MRYPLPLNSGVRSPVKEIRLPKEMTIRFHIGGGTPKTSSSGTPREDDLLIIEKNRSELIAGTVLLEKRMIEAVCKLLFRANPEDQLQRDFFAEEVMGASDFSFAFKRRVFTRLLERTDALDSGEVKELKAGLNKVMEWRNAFAHGNLQHDYNGGLVLAYFSGEHKELVLDDEFFEQVETTIRNCLYQCNGVIQATQRGSNNSSKAAQLRDAD